MNLGCLRLRYVGLCWVVFDRLGCVVLGCLKLGLVGLRRVVLRYVALICVMLC